LKEGSERRLHAEERARGIRQESDAAPWGFSLPEEFSNRQLSGLALKD